MLNEQGAHTRTPPAPYSRSIMDVTQEQVFAMVGRVTVENAVLKARNAQLAAEVVRLREMLTPAPESAGDAQANQETSPTPLPKMGAGK